MAAYRKSMNECENMQEQLDFVIDLKFSNIQDRRAGCKMFLLALLPSGSIRQQTFLLHQYECLQ